MTPLDVVVLLVALGGSFGVMGYARLVISRATGPQGVQGIGGPQGERGEAGEAGPVGPQGVQGLSWAQAHVHIWQRGSTEETAGKLVHVNMCADCGAIERRELFSLGLPSSQPTDDTSNY